MCIADTLIPVDLRIGSLSEGMAIDDLLAGYPALTRLGESGIPSGEWLEEPTDLVEAFCSRVASGILMPTGEFAALWPSQGVPRETARTVAWHFHVSALAALVRARTLGLIAQPTFAEVRAEEARSLAEAATTSGRPGGSFCNAAGARIGKRFILEVLASTARSIGRDIGRRYATRPGKVGRGGEPGAEALQLLSFVAARRPPWHPRSYL